MLPWANSIGSDHQNLQTLIKASVLIIASGLAVVVTAAVTHRFGKQNDYTVKNIDKYRRAWEEIFPLHARARPWESIEWQNYSHIIISGPQRSGTTYFTKYLSQKLNYTWLDETRNSVRFTDKLNLNSSFWLKDFDDPFARNHDNALKNLGLLRARESYVAQRPQWSSILHLLPTDSTTLIVFMARNCLEVFASQNRIMQQPYDSGWTCKYGRTIEWAKYNGDSELRKHVDLYGMICTIKQQAFLRYQLPYMQRLRRNVAVVSYESLRTFAAYMPKKMRANYTPKYVI
jgi:hypothetical protein